MKRSVVAVSLVLAGMGMSAVLVPLSAQSEPLKLSNGTFADAAILKFDPTIKFTGTIKGDVIVCPLPNTDKDDSTCVTYAELKRLFKPDPTGLPHYSVVEWKLKQALDDNDQLMLALNQKDIQIGQLLAAAANVQSSNISTAANNRQAAWLSQFEAAHPGKTFDFGSSKIVDKIIK